MDVTKFGKLRFGVVGYVIYGSGFRMQRLMLGIVKC